PGVPVVSLRTNTPINQGTNGTLNYTAQADGSTITNCTQTTAGHNIPVSPSTYPTSLGSLYSGSSTLTNLAPGSYNYSITCTSAEDMSASAAATLTVNPVLSLQPYCWFSPSSQTFDDPSKVAVFSIHTDHAAAPGQYLQWTTVGS